MPRHFPFDPARDVLGILRALYAYEKAKPFPPTRKLRKIERLARELGEAMMSAEQHDPGTAPYERALSRADGVAHGLREVVDIVDSLEPVVKAAIDRVLGRKPKEQERRFTWSTGRRPG